MSEYLQEFVEVESPESVSLRLEIAGLGSRFAAFLVDSLVQAVTSGLVVVVVVLGSIAFGVGARWASLASVSLAVGMVGVFLITWGYYTFFEVRRNGQTPGKALLGVRVVLDGGYPISFLPSMVRNLMRIIDVMPFCIPGIICTVAHRRRKRLGDLAAGTLVVKERKTRVPRPAPAPLPPWEAKPEEAKAFTAIEMEGVTEEELRMVREYLARRTELAHAARLALAQRLAGRLAAKLRRGVPLSDLLACERFLEDVDRASLPG